MKRLDPEARRTGSLIVLAALLMAFAPRLVDVALQLGQLLLEVPR